MKNKRYDIALIRDYLDGTLDSAAMYKLERAAQDDPLLMDLIQGMEMGVGEEHQNALLEIDSLLGNRLQQQRNVFPLWKLSSIAASVVFVLGAVFFLSKNDDKQKVADAASYETIDKKTKVESLSDTLRNLPTEETNQIAQNSRETRKPDISSNDNIIKEPVKDTNFKKAIIDTNQLIAEVVIQTYSPQRKSNMSVAKVEAKDLEQLDATNVLQGRIAGLSTSAAPKTYTGKVIDKRTNEPIIGASVQLSNTPYYTTSDVNGNFKLSLDARALDTLKSKQMRVMMLGYQQENLRLKNKDSLLIAMQPSSNSLNEVIIRGRVSNTLPEIETAHPLMGWDAYNKYLKENAISKSGKKESVTVTLIVTPDGKLSELKIIKGNKNLLNDVEDLVLNGPVWRGNKNGEPENVKFKIDFSK